MVSVAFLYAGDWMGKEVQEEEEEEGRLGRNDHGVLLFSSIRTSIS